MSDAALPLSQFGPVPEVVRKETLVSRSKFPCIDAHMHLSHRLLGPQPSASIGQLLQVMADCNIQAMFDLMTPRCCNKAATLAATWRSMYFSVAPPIRVPGSFPPWPASTITTAAPVLGRGRTVTGGCSGPPMRRYDRIAETSVSGT